MRRNHIPFCHVAGQSCARLSGPVAKRYMLPSDCRSPPLRSNKHVYKQPSYACPSTLLEYSRPSGFQRFSKRKDSSPFLRFQFICPRIHSALSHIS